jgi:hypothetical protein
MMPSGMIRIQGLRIAALVAALASATAHSNWVRFADMESISDAAAAAGWQASAVVPRRAAYHPLWEAQSDDLFDS